MDCLKKTKFFKYRVLDQEFVVISQKRSLVLKNTEICNILRSRKSINWLDNFYQVLQ